VKKDKKVSLNKGGNVVEIELDDYGQGMLFSPQEFQETRFQTLTLPVTPQVRKVDEKNIKLTADTFGAVEMGKVVQRMTIYTKNLEEQLKLEKVSEEEYNNKHNDNSLQELNN
ncbi:2535_t:CDS:2, partial [Funneliformis geosporum]